MTPGTSSPPTVEHVLRLLRAQARPDQLPGMARFGIRVDRALGISMPVLRRLAKQIGRDPALAEALWSTGILEARIVASLVADAASFPVERMDAWTAEFDCWALCDQVCKNLYGRSPHAWELIRRWARDRREFVRRAGFVMMAELAVHDRRAPDARFLHLLPIIVRHAGDDRNFVKKAVNWALRQIGKRNGILGDAALELAQRLADSDSHSARWVGRDALRDIAAHRRRKSRGRDS